MYNLMYISSVFKYGFKLKCFDARRTQFHLCNIFWPSFIKLLERTSYPRTINGASECCTNANIVCVYADHNMIKLEEGH